MSFNRSACSLLSLIVLVLPLLSRAEFGEETSPESASVELSALQKCANSEDTYFKKQKAFSCTLRASTIKVPVCVSIGKFYGFNPAGDSFFRLDFDAHSELGKKLPNHIRAGRGSIRETKRIDGCMLSVSRFLPGGSCVSSSVTWDSMDVVAKSLIYNSNALAWETHEVQFDLKFGAGKITSSRGKNFSTTAFQQQDVFIEECDEAL